MGRGPIALCSRQAARRFRPEAPFIDRCSPEKLALRGRTRHRSRGLATAGPASGASPPKALARMAGPAAAPRLITPKRAGQAPPVDFCNHCGSPAQLRSDRPPRGRSRHELPVARPCGQPRTSRCKAGRASSEQGPPRADCPRQHLPSDRSRRSFAPIRKGSDTSCRGVAPAPVGETRRRNKEQFPRIRRRSAHETPSGQGLRPISRREAGRKPRARGAFRRRAALGADAVLHRLFPSCGVLQWCLWHRRLIARR